MPKEGIQWGPVEFLSFAFISSVYRKLGIIYMEFMDIIVDSIDKSIHFLYYDPNVNRHSRKNTSLFPAYSLYIIFLKINEIE